MCLSAEVKVQAICWCLETSSSRLLLLIQVMHKNNKCIGPNRTEQFLSALILTNIPFVI